MSDLQHSSDLVDPSACGQQPTARIPSNARECLAYLTDVLMGVATLNPEIDILPSPSADGRILLQWPNNGPVFKLTVSPSNERARVVEWRGKTPVIVWEAS